MRLALILGALLLAAPAAADDKVAAVVADGTDVRKTVVVGPSGQVYEPDGEGAWTRDAEGGVAADVTGAARVDGDVVVTGRAAPLYRRDGTTWKRIQLGEDGRTVMSRGPSAGVAVGKAVLVPQKVKGKWTWKRVGSVPAKPTALWVDGTTVWASTDSALYHSKGGSFSKKGSAGGVLAGGTPWAITDAGLVDLDGKTTVKAELDGAAVTIAGAGGAPGEDALTVVADTGSGLVLARTAGKKLEKLDAVPGTGTVVAVVVDPHGDVLVAFRDGTLALRRGGSWTTGEVADDLPKAKKGSRPARTM